MKAQWIRCKNDNCSKRLRVEINDIESKPILFCSDRCLNSIFSENEKLNHNFNYEDPKEVRRLVKNLISQTKRLQNELENLRKIRKTYFGLFKNYNLKDEVYKRKWSFEDEVNK